MTTPLRLTLLSKNHDRKKFTSGLDSVDRYLKERARVSADRHTAKTYVLVDQSTDKQQTIWAYYTLASEQFSPPEGDKRFANYNHTLPGLLLAQLGVDKKYQGHGVGETMLVRAILEAAKLQLNTPIAITGLYLDPANKELVGFYEKHGFMKVSSDTENMRLWLPIERCIEQYKISQNITESLEN